LQDKDIKCSLFIHRDQEDNNNVIIVFQGFETKDECLQFVKTYKSDHEEYREIDEQYYGTKYTIH
jgi:ABC-type metal ion transport system substrate-binding protein